MSESKSSPAEQIRAYLEEGERLGREATPGPWWDESGVIHASYPNTTNTVHPARADRYEDAAFIAAAREREPRERRALVEALASDLIAAAQPLGSMDKTLAEGKLRRVAAILRGEPTDGR